jgi:DNA-binding response OmpR family regulator
MSKKIKKILIIEDEELILRALTEGLKRRNYEICTAINGKIGLKKINQENPDLILLDLMLPLMSGQEVLQKMNDIKIIDKIPVIVLTNVSDGATLKECMNLGAKEYIIKSNFSFNDMEEIFKKIEME